MSRAGKWARPPAPGSSGAMGWLSDALLRDWGTKGVALAVALVVFVITRDEVTRTFTLPLAVQSDSERVLLTALPDSIEVEVRGPWAKLAKVRANELGSVSLALQDAQPGPLRLDPAQVVMPEGVVLSNLVYEAVDLRFEKIIERPLAVIPSVAGEVHPDYERVAVVASPAKWTVRGPQSAIETLQGLQTETLSLEGASETVTQRVALIRPESGVLFKGLIEGGVASVDVRIEVRPRDDAKEIEIKVERAVLDAIGRVAPNLQPSRVVGVQKVMVRGEKPALRQLARIDEPLTMSLEIESFDPPTARSQKTGKLSAKILFSWAEDVPAEVRDVLRFSPAFVRQELVLSPKPASADPSPAP